MKYYVWVLTEVDCSLNLKSLSNEEVLSFLKKHMGGYNDNDLARLLEVTQVAPSVKGYEWEQLRFDGFTQIGTLPKGG